jgi:hypothetical protein
VDPLELGIPQGSELEEGEGSMTQASDWISTGEAVRLFEFSLSGRTFRDKYRDRFPWFLTPGGQYRWNKVAIEQEMALMHSRAS